MKKITGTIVFFSLLILTTGAIAQTGKVVAHSIQKAHLIPRELPVLNANKANNLHGVKYFYGQMQLNYGLTDQYCVGASHYYYYSPPAILNAGFTAADSGTGTTKNYTGLHSATVAFDTLLDDKDSGYFLYPRIYGIDTIFAVLGYHNTSGSNDTLTFEIGNVSNAGYPIRTQIYSLDTVIIPPHSPALPGYNLDSAYEIYIIPNKGMGTSPPVSAPSHWHFEVTISALYNSKLDSLGLFYRAQSTFCAGPPAYTFVETGTCAGVPIGPHIINSYQTGWQFYNTLSYSGNGTILTWPLANGFIGNSNGNFGDYWKYPSCKSDTEFLYFQDNWMWVGLYNEPEAVNKIYNESCLSVNQNYPDPFNGKTEIIYNLTKPSDVIFSICDLTGRELVNNKYSAVTTGQHEITIDAKQFNQGIYFYTFNVNGFKVAKKMVISQ